MSGVNGITSSVSNVLNAAIANASLNNQLSVQVAVKAKDAVEQEGQNALKLIMSATKVDVRV